MKIVVCLRYHCSLYDVIRAYRKKEEAIYVADIGERYETTRITTPLRGRDPLEQKLAENYRRRVYRLLFIGFSFSLITKSRRPILRSDEISSTRSTAFGFLSRLYTTLNLLRSLSLADSIR